MTRDIQSPLGASAIEWAAMRSHIACMAHIIQLDLGAFMSNLGVKGHPKYWEAHEHDQQFGENGSTAIGHSQRLQQEGNTRIKKVSAMRLGFTKIIQKVRISWHFESAETDPHIAVNACCIDYADNWSLKQVHWLSKMHSTNRSTTYYGYETQLGLHSGVAWVSLPITRIHLQVT